jgi:proteic killer suppression protein
MFLNVIRSFRGAQTEMIWLGRRSRRLPFDIQQTALRKLRLINAAKRIEDMAAPPGNRLEALVGDRNGQRSIRINQQWRICFRWREGGADDVEICDYN